MSKSRAKYAEDFKENAVELPYADAQAVAEVAAYPGISIEKEVYANGERKKYATVEKEKKVYIYSDNAVRHAALSCRQCARHSL